jgi:sugar-specific transcriptional regulator TrmB
MSETTVLRTAYEAIKQEFSRISNLLYAQNPLEKYTNNIRGKFNDRISTVQTMLEEIEKAIDSNKPWEGWDKYVELKTELIPSLSSELLAVIGGVYMIEAHLDDPGETLGYTADSVHKPLSFSDLAKELVGDLARRTGRMWASVLIVGEEFFKDSEAEIIRLRFPACDIWNLPFTAHEYGYLVARKDLSERVLERVRKAREKVKESVNPAKHENSTLPEDKGCFLKEVSDLWEKYYKLDSASERNQFMESFEVNVDKLADQQVNHFCRLFADAFATFFVGPAYVHALLHLRFMPDETLYRPSRDVPSFASRFLFALETLKWMNDEPIIDPSNNLDLFRQEIVARGIPALWKQAVTSAQQEDLYDEIKIQYQPWLDQIKQALTAGFRTPTAIGTTYANWREAQKFEKQLHTKPSVFPRPQRWAVMNAAWSARRQNPAAVTQIQLNSLKLLNLEDNDLIQRPPSEDSLLTGRKG